MSVRTPEAFVRKSTWQVADESRPLESASYIILTGNDLFIGKNEAYIMNRKKKENSVLRKEGDVYAFDFLFFLKCHVAQQGQSSTSPWKLTQSIKLQKEENYGSRRRLTTAN